MRRKTQTTTLGGPLSAPGGPLSANDAFDLYEPLRIGREIWIDLLPPGPVLFFQPGNGDLRLCRRIVLGSIRSPVSGFLQHQTATAGIAAGFDQENRMCRPGVCPEDPFRGEDAVQELKRRPAGRPLP
jgi:hypothetical protein